MSQRMDEMRVITTAMMPTNSAGITAVVAPESGNTQPPFYVIF